MYESAADCISTRIGRAGWSQEHKLVAQIAPVTNAHRGERRQPLLTADLLESIVNRSVRSLDLHTPFALLKYLAILLVKFLSIGPVCICISFLCLFVTGVI